MTQKQAALNLLADGRPHPHTELYSQLRGNPNIVSRLRKDGHNIATWREGKLWMYQLLPDGNQRPQPAPTRDGTIPELHEDQLSLEDSVLEEPPSTRTGHVRLPQIQPSPMACSPPRGGSSSAVSDPQSWSARTFATNGRGQESPSGIVLAFTQCERSS